MSLRTEKSVRKAMEEEHGQRVSTATMSRAIQDVGWTRKKDADGLRARRRGAQSGMNTPNTGALLIFVMTPAVTGFPALTVYGEFL